MQIFFAETLKKLRTNKGFSQRELAERMYVTRSTVARWESGSRLPDAVMIARLSKCLDTDVNTLLSAAVESDDAPNVIMVDDRKIFLSGALPILEEVMPNATQRQSNIQKQIESPWLFLILNWEKQTALTFVAPYSQSILKQMWFI